MPIAYRIVALALLGVVLVAADAVPALATVRLDLSAETAGAPPTLILPLVGEWSVAAEGDKRVLRVDGGRWQHGRVPTSLADAGKTLFAGRGSAFTERIRAKPDYPLAAVPAVADFRSGTISVRFKSLAGSEDQAAGIAFGLDATGDYFLVRANALENNIGFFKVIDGSRKTIKWVENTPTATNQWHSLSLTVARVDLVVSLDGTACMHEVLPSPVAGKVALWSKSDSVVLFNDITITPIKP